MGGDADLAALAAFPLSTPSVLVVSFARKVCISRTFWMLEKQMWDVV
jgi:hypothetical protein